MGLELNWPTGFNLPRLTVNRGETDDSSMKSTQLAKKGIEANLFRSVKAP